MKFKFLSSVSICFLVLSLPQLSNAQTANGPDELKAIYACKGMADSSLRLACYDQAVGRFEAAQNSGDVIAVSKTQVEAVEKEAFGFNIPSLPSLGGLFGGSKKKAQTSKTNPLTAPVTQSETKTAELPSKTTEPTPPPALKSKPEPSNIKSVSLDISKTTEFGYKKTRFFFSNNQVWEQVDGTKVRIPKVRNGKPNTAKISKAALGSFILRINGKGSAIRVRRVR